MENNKKEQLKQPAALSSTRRKRDRNDQYRNYNNSNRYNNNNNNGDRDDYYNHRGRGYGRGGGGGRGRGRSRGRSRGRDRDRDSYHGGGRGGRDRGGYMYNGNSNSRGGHHRNDNFSNNNDNGDDRYDRECHRQRMDEDHSTAVIQQSSGSGPQRSVEGWIIFVTSLHEEAQEEDVKEIFAEYGPIINIRVNLDSLSGFCKGYGLIEYKKKSEAQDAINALHGKEVLGKTIRVDWAFVGGGSADDDGMRGANKGVNRHRR